MSSGGKYSVQVIKRHRMQPAYCAVKLNGWDYLVPLFKYCCNNWFNIWGIIWWCCRTLGFLPGHFLWKEDRTSVTLWNRSIGSIKSQNIVYFFFRITKRSLPRDSVDPLNVDQRVKDSSLDWLATGARHFLLLGHRGVDAGIVMVIQLFYWFSLCYSV